jgi:hypothetical protein
VRKTVAGDPRFRIIEFPDNVGFYRNFERLLARVPDDVGWIALSDQDDRWYQDKLAVLVPLLDDTQLVTGQANVVDRDGNSTGEPTLRRRIGVTAEMIDNQVTGSLCVLRRELLDVALPFPAPTRSAFHDHWLGVCAAASGGFGLSPVFVQDYVQHDGNVIGEEKGSTLRQRLRRLAGESEGGAFAGMRYLRQNRWGWRVAMSREILARADGLARGDERILRAIAADRFSFTLLRGFLSAVFAGDAPPLRAMALVAGATWPRTPS